MLARPQDRRHLPLRPGGPKLYCLPLLRRQPGALIQQMASTRRLTCTRPRIESSRAASRKHVETLNPLHLVLGYPNTVPPVVSISNSHAAQLLKWLHACARMQAGVELHGRMPASSVCAHMKTCLNLDTGTVSLRCVLPSGAPHGLLGSVALMKDFVRVSVVQWSCTCLSVSVQARLLSSLCAPSPIQVAGIESDCGLQKAPAALSRDTDTERGAEGKMHPSKTGDEGMRTAWGNCGGAKPGDPPPRAGAYGGGMQVVRCKKI